MKLKITIKEVVEEERYLDENENFILSLWIDSFGKEVDSEIENYFEKIGFDYREYVNGNIATFRKETIRDATEEEELAWQTIRLNDKSPYEQRITLHSLVGCFECKNEYTLDTAKEILKNKEVILELVE